MAPNARARISPGAAWLAGAILLIALATLPPQPQPPHATEPTLRALIPQSIRPRDVAQNIALYLPLGVVLGLRGASFAAIAGVSAGLSLATELLQFRIPGRDPNALDVLVNTLAAVAAWSVVRSRRYGARASRTFASVDRWLARARTPDAGFASRLAVAWALAVAAIVVATAALLRPAPLPFGGLAIGTPFLDRSNGPLYIGTNGLPDGYFKGTIDEVRIYDAALSAAQIRADMDGPARASAPGTPHLVAAYGFDRSNGAVAHDDAGRGHDGKGSGTAWSDNGRLGGALTFDGVSSRVVVAHSPAFDFTDGMTLAAWVKAAESPADEMTVVSRPGSVYYLFETRRQGTFMSMGGGRFGAIPRSAQALDAFRWDTWTHLATTYDGQAFRLYVNGALASTTTHWSPHRLDDVRLNGMAVPAGIVADADAFRAALKAPLTLKGTLACGRKNDTPAHVFLAAGLQSTAAFALNARGADLFVKPLTMPARLGFASPATRVSGVFDACADSERRLALAGRLQNPNVTLEGEPADARAPGLGAGWAFIVHADLLPRWAETLGTFAWLALLAAPLGLWARRSIAFAAACAIVLAAIAGAPYVFESRAAVGTDAAALTAGAAIGAAVRRTRTGES